VISNECGGPAASNGNTLWPRNRMPVFYPFSCNRSCSFALRQLGCPIVVSDWLAGRFDRCLLLTESSLSVAVELQEEAELVCKGPDSVGGCVDIEVGFVATVDRDLINELLASGEIAEQRFAVVQPRVRKAVVWGCRLGWRDWLVARLRVGFRFHRKLACRCQPIRCPTTSVAFDVSVWSRRLVCHRAPGVGSEFFACIVPVCDFI